MIMTPRLRRSSLAAHLTLAVGWIGAVAGYIVLDVAAAPAKMPRRCVLPILGWS